MMFTEREVWERVQHAADYGYWLAIKHATLVGVALLAAYVLWHIPTGVVK